MALASVGFAAAGLVAPGLVGRASGIGRRGARLLAVRDLVVAVALFRGGPQGLLARGVSDAGDALLFARRRPVLSALAATSAVLNLAAANDARGGAASAPSFGRA
jgi:hypothetical protein